MSVVHKVVHTHTTKKSSFSRASLVLCGKQPETPLESVCGCGVGVGTPSGLKTRCRRNLRGSYPFAMFGMAGQ